jgi:hypothetical protein
MPPPSPLCAGRSAITLLAAAFFDLLQSLLEQAAHDPLLRGAVALGQGVDVLQELCAQPDIEWQRHMLGDWKRSHWVLS